jgi:hypothetical protein
MAVKIRHRKGKWWVYIDHEGATKGEVRRGAKATAKRVAETIGAKLALGDFAVVGEKERPSITTGTVARRLRTARTANRARTTATKRQGGAT